MKQTNGRKPRTGQQKLTVQFRNGYIDFKHDYTADKLRWTDTGSEWDIVAVELSKGE